MQLIIRLYLIANNKKVVFKLQLYVIVMLNLQLNEKVVIVFASNINYYFFNSKRHLDMSEMCPRMKVILMDI